MVEQGKKHKNEGTSREKGKPEGEEEEEEQEENLWEEEGNENMNITKTVGRV